MYKSTKAGLLAIAAILLSSTATIAAQSNENGVNLYLHGQYETAMPYLERAAAAGGGAQVHYYLADTYYRLGRTGDALSEYNISYKMDPRSNVSAYCQQMIRTLQTFNPGKPDVADPNTLPQYRGQGKGTAPTPTVQEAGPQPGQKLGKIMLPPVADAPSFTESAEVRRWDYLARVRFAAQANDQVNKAQIHLKTTQALLKEVRKVANRALIPQKRAWGETEKDWLNRVQKGGIKEGSLTEPYEKSVANAQDILSDAKAVQSACKHAASGDEGEVPTTLVPYNGEVWSTGNNPF